MARLAPIIVVEDFGAIDKALTVLATEFFWRLILSDYLTLLRCEAEHLTDQFVYCGVNAGRV